MQLVGSANFVGYAFLPVVAMYCCSRSPNLCYSSPATPCLLFMNYNVIISRYAFQVIDYYTKKGVVAQLHAEKPPNEVTVAVQKALSWRGETSRGSTFTFWCLFQLSKIFPFVHEIGEFRSNCPNVSMFMETFAIASAFNLK